MNLKLVSFAAAAALVAVSFAPASFAATTTTKTTAGTMKPAMKTAMAPDPKRFKTEALASASCPADTVVWANISTKIFHLKGTATYGKTKNGAYMCETSAKAEGFKPTKKPEKVVAAASSMKATTTTTKSN
jgi:hypothetical protein